MNKQTPLQQIKNNYYKMSETQFHTWLAQNIDRLAQEEKLTVIESYEKDYGKDALGREMISSIESGNPTVEAKEYLKKFMLKGDYNGNSGTKN